MNSMPTFSSRFDAFHDQAAAATGLDDFGATDYVMPLKLLLTDYDRGYLGAVGVQMAAGAITGLLISRLFAEKGFKAHPDFAAAPIERPIIITGMARTGSTSLQRLLAQDPDSQWITPWLGNTPMPRPPRESWDSNPWYQMTVQGIQQFHQMIPAIKSLHPQTAAGADECRFGLEPGFWSPGLAFLGAVHEYAEWMVEADARYAYARYRKVLALIAGGDRRRWLLKDPTMHPWAPQTLIDTFPDACFVYTHRDPVKAMASLSDMMYVVRREREPALTPEQNGREQLALWGPAINKTETALRSLHPSRVCDVHIDELQADPVATAERIYRYFQLPVSEAARQNWRHLADTDARGGHGAHPCKAEDSGFSARDVRSRLDTYCDGYEQRYVAQSQARLA